MWKSDSQIHQVEHCEEKVKILIWAGQSDCGCKPDGHWAVKQTNYVKWLRGTAKTVSLPIHKAKQGSRPRD
jgi:hypothetical protein